MSPMIPHSGRNRLKSYLDWKRLMMVLFPHFVKKNRSITKSNLKVPTGYGVKDNNKKTDLLYNEYIVYDVAQVLVEHLSFTRF